MKKNLLKILAILFLVALNLTLFNKFSFSLFVPNLIYLTSIVLVFKGFLADSFLVAVLGGLMLDVISPFRFGFYTSVLILILIFLHFVLLKNMPALNLILIFLSFFGIFIFVDGLLTLMTHTMPNWSIFLDAALNGVLGLIIYFIFAKFLKQEEINVNF